MDAEVVKAKKPIYKRWWVWVIVIVSLVIIINSGGDGSKNSQNNPAPQTANTQTAQTPAIKVTATKLMADYEANEVAADTQYKGKVVEVSGTIKNIGKDILDTPYVSLESGNIIYTVQCMFEKSDASKLVNLAKNQKITLTGTVSAKLGNVLVKGCSF